jgi:hypothetical protein
MHILVSFIQLPHCLGLLPTHQGVVDGIEVKWIAKQSLYLLILPLTVHVLPRAHKVPPWIYTN